MTRSKQTETGKSKEETNPAVPETNPAAEETGTVPFTPREEGDDDPEAAPKKARKAKAKDSNPPEPIPGLTEGRIVHYCLPDGKRRGEHRAAVVTYIHDHGSGLVNLNVFLNGAMDYGAHEHPGNNLFCEKVKFSSVPQAEGQWHFIERA